MQTKPTAEDPVNNDSSNEAGTQPSADQSSDTIQLISPPPSRPATPDLPRVPLPSPSYTAKASFLSKPCIPSYSLYRPASGPTGGTWNDQADRVTSHFPISIFCNPISNNISSHYRTNTDIFNDSHLQSNLPPLGLSQNLSYINSYKACEFFHLARRCRIQLGLLGAALLDNGDNNVADEPSRTNN